ncbi:hypothetical protein INP57_11840 [Saccharopolyspora sp. HNM0986]|uniref:hypothetical protein n=1 Tax=Saccharopolyspora galaxeae TaxID=2781241 RepID=UPI00190D041F|nr:hypothetical protein [Saccharopolyspora sp. HNM0986]MBK0867504.1 hypothetical protein [Saccharopolyspora sp. HNM0986]
MTAPAPPPAPGGPGQQITVTPENVLAARKAILAAAEDARNKLVAKQTDLSVRSPARDDISVAASATWTANLMGDPDSHYNRLMSYVLQVEQLGHRLGEAAKQYGYTDEEIAASFQAKPGKMT